MPENRFPPPLEPAQRRTFLGREQSCRFPDCVFTRGCVGLQTCQASGVQRVSRKPNIRLTKRQQSTATCPNYSGKSCRHISSHCGTCHTECLRFCCD